MEINSRSVFLIGALILVLIFGVGGFGQTSADLIVNGDASNCSVSGDNLYCTIQNAVDAASSGDTIKIIGKGKRADSGGPLALFVVNPYSENIEVSKDDLTLFGVEGTTTGPVEFCEYNLVTGEKSCWEETVTAYHKPFVEGGWIEDGNYTDAGHTLLLEGTESDPLTGVSVGPEDLSEYSRLVLTNGGIGQPGGDDVAGALWLTHVEGSEIRFVDATSSEVGIGLYRSRKNTIRDSNNYLNVGAGVELNYSNKNNIIDTTFFKNSGGVLLKNSDGNKIGEEKDGSLPSDFSPEDVIGSEDVGFETIKDHFSNILLGNIDPNLNDPENDPTFDPSDQSSGNYGIKLINSEKNLTINNLIAGYIKTDGDGGNGGSLDTGVVLEDSASNNIIGNWILLNSDGIKVGPHPEGSDGNEIRKNFIARNGFYYDQDHEDGPFVRVPGMGHGIELWNSDNNILSGNKITQNAIDGIYLMGSTGNTIGRVQEKGYSGNEIYENTKGLYIWSSSDFNRIIGNEIYENYTKGIYSMSSDNNIIEENLIHNNEDEGIFFWGGKSNKILNNEVYYNSAGIQFGSPHKPGGENNYISGNKIYANSEEGIALFASESSYILGNEIYNNKVVGIRLGDSDGNRIEDNTVRANAAGILLGDGSEDNEIISNSIVSNEEYGISLLNSYGNLFDENVVKTNDVDYSSQANASAFGINLEGSGDNSFENVDIVDISSEAGGLTAKSNASGVDLLESNHNTFENVDIIGISSEAYASAMPIASANASALGINLEGSDDNTFENVDIVDISTYARAVGDYGASANANTYGVHLEESDDNIFENVETRDVSNNTSISVTFPGQSVPTLSSVRNEENANSANSYGIGLYNSSGNLFLFNTIENSGCGLISDNLSEGNTIHFSSIINNTEFGVRNESTDSLDAILNYWGSDSGPTHSSNPKGTGDAISDKVAYSPWLADSIVNGTGIDTAPNTAGVQLPDTVNIMVDDVGPKPTTKDGNTGYLNQAIWGSNELRGTDKINLFPGDYTASPNQPVTDSSEIVSCTGCPTAASIDGELVIETSDVNVGGRDTYTNEGFNVNADVTINPGVDATNVHINWNNIYGEVANNGTGTLDATYNWWGDDNPEDSVEGNVDYSNHLPATVCSVLDYMEENDLEDDPEAAVAGMACEQGSASEQAACELTTMGLDTDQAEQLVVQHGATRVLNAKETADTSGEFTQLLGGYSLPAGAAGGLTNNVVAGGAGSVGDRTVGAVFTKGETIEVSFPLADFQGEPTTNLTPTVSVVELDEDGDKKGLERVTTATYDEDEDAYVTTFETTSLEPGPYEVQIDLPDLSALQQVIEVEGD
ncbi:right-handed parallel beta-helix repeat-containing protein [Candidatus Bipolaricaulota bacterium]|nr:right-handed parallel beta-helix repeat-containing protein [Candidatus Bipolaricaulota bacterium]